MPEEERKDKKKAYNRSAVFHYERVVQFAEATGNFGIVEYGRGRLAELRNLEQPDENALKDVKKITRRAELKRHLAAKKAAAEASY